MKNLRAILFVIVLILGLPLVAAAAQQVEIVNPNGVVSSGDWGPAPTAGILSDWGADPDASFASAFYYGSMTVDLEEPKAGPYTAIKVKLRARSVYGDTDLNVGIYAGGAQIGNSSWDLRFSGAFAEYSNEWTGLNMTAADLADLQVEIVITYFWDQMDISAVQVELVSEGADPIPVVTDPIPVNIDYRPFRNSNPLNYRSHGNVLVAIFGSADFDVRQIDRESLLLAGVAPVRGALRIGKIYSRTDGACDDYEDLVLMFGTQQLIQALEISRGRELKNGEPVILSLTGNLKDDGATPIEGQDTAVVFGKHHKDKKKGKWKDHWKWWKEKRHQREKD
jgi:hypothetical protein